MLYGGGAISVERIYRIEAWEHNQKKRHRYVHENDDSDLLAPSYYGATSHRHWTKRLWKKAHIIDTFVTHTAPYFFFFFRKSGLESWAGNDANHLQDIRQERSVIDDIYNALKNQPVTHWCYGHFHQSWHSTIEGIFFKMFDIMELYKIK